MIGTLEKTALLRGVLFFASLEEEQLRAVAQLAEPLHVEAETTVFAQGDPGVHLFVVVAGRLRVLVDGRSTAELGEKEIFGELALLDHQPRTATVVALTSVDLLRLSHDAFEELLDEHPNLAAALIPAVLRYVRRS